MFKMIKVLGITVLAAMLIAGCTPNKQKPVTPTNNPNPTDLNNNKTDLNNTNTNSTDNKIEKYDTDINMGNIKKKK
ncbi:hypothetical protein ACQKP0_21420 [Heyndrickxia sp. NPDC080065]|uniref:hypothetical protein n=1 Tax=Heyndrickxia sp. NPDC080065 TaxID=3390568 RepID=UPI003D0894FF